jgi:alkylresorcinol/alkylpyrone synthase
VTGYAPRLLALTTAVPPFVLRQQEVQAASLRLFDCRDSEVARLQPVYDNAGIDTRHSCVPLDWYLRPHGWVERMKLFADNALALIERAAREALAQAGRRSQDVDAVVAVSTTGIATPSLDALLAERLGLRRDVRRLPVFGLGCAGGVLGLTRAATLARAEPGSLVLLVVVELCALTFRAGDRSKSNIVATALFGDGAAAVLVGDGDGPIVGPGGEHLWPDSLDVMGWHIEEDGLGVLFSRDIPALVRGQLREAASGFLARHGLTLAGIDGVVCHPGGAKVIDALEEAFAVPPGGLAAARDVLRRFGNMSAPSVLFVLEEMQGTMAPGRYLMSALGPGFTAGFQLLEQR